MSRDQSPKSRSLHYNHIPYLKEWLHSNGFKWRKGNPSGYAVFEVQHDGHWMGIYSRQSSQHHMRIDKRLYPVIRRFMKQRKQT